MSKWTKLLRTPGLFFRDFFLKRYPLLLTHHGALVAEASAELEPEFPIDLVMTWVDNSDPAWLADFARYHEPDKDYVASSTSPARFASHQELKYSLRAIDRYMPWVRTIYLVTSQTPPPWLLPALGRLVVVPHQELIEPCFLPTFNSHVIEAHLHRIRGLSEHYIYFNDDIFPFQEVRKSDFFTSNGLVKLFYDRDKPVSKSLAAHTPTGFALRNAAGLIQDEFQKDLPFLSSHVAFPQLKSINSALFTKLNSAFFHERFRSRQDYALPSQLHNYWAYFLQKGMTTCVPYNYFNVRARSASMQYQFLRESRQKPLFICLNDNDCRQEWEHWEEHMLQFMEDTFPWPSSFECRSLQPHRAR